MQRTGIVTLYNHLKIWGFITEDHTGESWFFHASNSPGYSPTLGDHVEFKTAAPISLGKKHQAVDLRLVGGAQ
jgi:cold shock CspA family protein